MIAAIWLNTLIDMPYIQSPSSAPITASGTVVMITSGCRKLSNCAASTRNTTISARTNMK